MERERLPRDNAQGPQVCRVTCRSSYGHFYVHQSCDRFTILSYLFMYTYRMVCYPYSESTAHGCADPIRSLLFPTSVDNPNVLICLYFTARPLTQSAGARTLTRWRRWARAKDVSSIPIRSPSQQAWDDNTKQSEKVHRQRT